MSARPSGHGPVFSEPDFPVKFFATRRLLRGPKTRPQTPRPVCSPAASVHGRRHGTAKVCRWGPKAPGAPGVPYFPASRRARLPTAGAGPDGAGAFRRFPQGRDQTFRQTAFAGQPGRAAAGVPRCSTCRRLRPGHAGRPRGGGEPARGRRGASLPREKAGLQAFGAVGDGYRAKPAQRQRGGPRGRSAQALPDTEGARPPG